MGQKRTYRLLGTDPYEVLGITPETTEGEAKLFYRRLALKYHPDRNGGSAEAAARFKEASDAWDEVQELLPRSAVPFPDIDPDDPGFEDAIAQWLLDMDAAMPPKPVREAAPAEPASRTWSTVASETSGTAMTNGRAGPLKDWRTLKLKRKKDAIGLEKINTQEAALLLGFANAFAALKIVQQNNPDLCLYDAIVARAQKSSSTALVIVGAEAVDGPACLRALKDPMASIDAATENFAVIAPHVKYSGVTVNPQKLALDLAFLEDYLRTQLAPRLAKRGGDESKETRVVRY
jgi:hypothetical protein